MAQSKIKKFQSTVVQFYNTEGRHNLPWRKTKNPYKILVSEIMLQQTQVDRVIPYYKKFLKVFPTVRSLSNASLGEVLKVWQGLGYNRRAKMLHNAALSVVTNHNGKMPKNYKKLVALPGVGDYTAKAVRVFAYNEKEFLIETNVRSVYIHHFFQNQEQVSDKEIFILLEKTYPSKVEPRVWYAALMDYGSYLKRTALNPSRKSKHHIKQKPFKGSNREVRGAIIRALSKGSQTLTELQKLPFTQTTLKDQISVLEKEGLVVYERDFYRLP